MLCESDAIEKVVDSDPFQGVKVMKDTRLYVTFLSEEVKSVLKIPYITPDKSFRILCLKDNMIFSIHDLLKTGTRDAMSILEKEFGKNITTRNWNTIVKILNK